MLEEPTKQRYVSLRFVDSSSILGIPIAVRVELTSPYHPADPQPMHQQDFSAVEGGVRYLNALLDANGDPVFECVDSPVYGTTYRCATLGYQPEYRDWTTIFGFDNVHIAANAIIPDSRYTLVELPLSCAGSELICVTTGPPLELSTARSGDTNGDGNSNVTEVVNIVDIVKQTFGSLSARFTRARSTYTKPQFDFPNTTDIVLTVDSVKLVAYQLPVNSRKRIGFYSPQ